MSRLRAVPQGAVWCSLALWTLQASAQTVVLEYDFETPGNTEGWSALNPGSHPIANFGQRTAVGGSEGVLYGEISTNDPQLDLRQSGVLSLPEGYSWGKAEFRVRQLEPDGQGGFTPRAFSSSGTHFSVLNAANAFTNLTNPLSVRDGGGGGNGYAFRIQSNEILLTDCSAETFRHGFVISFMRASGIVIHQSLDADSRKATGVTSTLLRTGSSGSDFHMWFSPSCLIDDMTLHNSLYRIVHRLGVSNDHNAVTAHSVVWNIRAMGTRFPLAVASSQTRYGYIIGTSGDRPSVSYQPPNGWAHVYDTDGARSAPDDLVEGVGDGATLQPQSLYLDQLARRLAEIHHL